MASEKYPVSARLKLRLLGGWLRRKVEVARQTGQVAQMIRGCRRLGGWGDAEAQYLLGECYSSGIGVVRNLPEAAAWLRKAAAQGHQAAQYSLALILLFGCHQANAAAFQPGHFYGKEDANRDLLFPAGLEVPPSPEEAAIWLGQAAESGHPAAMCQLALLHADGKGTEQNSARAVELLRTACKTNLPLAHFLLAQYTMNGQHGIERDFATAMDHLEIAANQGHVESCYQLGTMLVKPDMPRQDAVKAVRWLGKAGQHRHLRAMVQLAKLYGEGKLVPRDEPKAANWLRKAAALGDAEAQWLLGTLYQKGCGVDQDPYEAIHWYEKAGNQGVVAAQYALAMMYRQGAGILPNNKLAAEWFARAVVGGDFRAMINLALLELSGALGPCDRTKAEQLFAQAETRTTDPIVLQQIQRYREMHLAGQARG